MKQSKDRKYDIIVALPTYNEADSVINTLQKIDVGLVKYFSGYHSLIVNVDSKSTDGTSSVFLSTTTRTEKISLTNKRRLRGKGTNIFLILKLARKLGAKYIATIDADVTTITEKWPKLLLDPIVHEKMDFVTPIYTRNRYEGNTTNHFCFPLLYAWFGKWLNQPIGGDFAMSSNFVDYVLNQQKPKNAFLYGIDIFLSTHALGANFKVKEVYLGRKIHKPSFDKIVPMFQQVAATMLFVLSQYRNQRDILKSDIAIENDQRIDPFIRKPNPTNILFLKNYAFKSLQQLPFKDMREYLGIDLKEIDLIQNEQVSIFENVWTKILSNLSNYIVNHSVSDKTATKIATTLSPFFFLRVLSYFKELEHIKECKDINALIFNQAKKLRLTLVRGKVTVT
ncbi:MAG: glycosyltransferase [Patescibacteria group bacterium]